MLVGLLFVIVVFGAVPYVQGSANEEIEKLVLQWAPLVWLAPGEKFMPSPVEYFLENIYITEDSGGRKISNIAKAEILKGKNSKSFFLVAKGNLDTLKRNASSFLYGRNPKENRVPVYVIITKCTSQQPKDSNNDFYFHVTYWFFYPYNEGKEVCFLGKVPAPLIFGSCFGQKKTMGNHVGDWEHMSLSFQGRPFPHEMFLAVHDTGVYYKYDVFKRIFRYDSQITRKGIVQGSKFPPLVRLSGGHPVLFSAYGSHGLWAAPGDHRYVRVPQLFDKNGYGTPWKTWELLEFIHVGGVNLPHWIHFEGKWGNPKSNCLLFKKLGICELSDGPTGIFQKKQDFYCWS